MQKKQTIQEEAEILLSKKLREYKINKLVKLLNIVHCRESWLAEAKLNNTASHYIDSRKWEIKELKKEIKRVKKLTYIPS